MKYNRFSSDKPFRFVGALWNRNDKLPESIKFKGNFQISPSAYSDEEKEKILQAIKDGKKIELSIVEYKGKSENANHPVYSVTFGGIEV